MYPNINNCLFSYFFFNWHPSYFEIYSFRILSHQILPHIHLKHPRLYYSHLIFFSFDSFSKIAIAANGELGVLEGRTVALIHPIVMGGLYLFTLWAGYLGWQWRRVRTIQEEISELKKQLKASSSSTDESSSDSPVEAQIEKLTEERKELLKGSFRDRHYNAGSILLGFGVIEAIGGGLDTYYRTGQLFPGPHLFGGAAITALWAAAAALAPAMQKGNETARNAHIALNVLNVLLFTSQIPTGFEILSSVFEYTTWP
ncbi:hypothetical protein Sjap_005640 [Stephania japonica]|uniref:Uncharacterized protein n=1 Tax=Stephania japonica TaxID=461633 RepID=A0AAP0K4I9_9MAGN